MIYRIENKVLQVEVETLGAQLKSIKSKASGFEYLWQGDERYWKGRAYNLFPIVGRLYEGKYTVNGTEHEMSIHGFARNSEFTVVKKSSSYVVFAISSNDETKKSYPFDFIFEIGYFLKGKTLVVNYEVKNIGKETMYFGLGGHPGFNIPFDGGEFEDYYVEFKKGSEPKKLLLTENYLMSENKENFILTDGKLNLKHNLFDDDAIILENSGHEIKIKRNGGSREIKVVFPKMNFVGLWHTVKSDAPFMCVEPWKTLPSYDGKVEPFESKQSVGILEADKEYNCPFTITIKE